MFDPVHTKIGEGGRIIIPVHLRHHLNLAIGDEIILHVQAHEIYLRTPQQALRKLQDKVKTYQASTKQPVSLVDELLATRRAESAHES